jgi:hypothetical protein
MANDTESRKVSRSQRSLKKTAEEKATPPSLPTLKPSGDPPISQDIKPEEAPSIIPKGI